MTPSKNFLFAIHNLNVTYPMDNLEPKDVLKNIHQKFYKNHLYVVLGGNGVGKTTFVKAMLGELETTELYKKYIKYNDQHIDAKSFVKQVRIGYIPQHPQEALIDSFSIGENFAFRPKIRNTLSLQSWLNTYVYSKKEEEKIRQFLTLYNFFDFLYDNLNEPVSNLSGGQQQLLNLAIVLYLKPDLIIMDEPTSKLDSEKKSEFWKSIFELHRDENNQMTFIITTHDKDLVNFGNKENCTKLFIDDKNYAICENHIELI